jgi:hypothetical protein
MYVQDRFITMQGGNTANGDNPNDNDNDSQDQNQRSNGSNDGDGSSHSDGGVGAGAVTGDALVELPTLPLPPTTPELLVELEDHAAGEPGIKLDHIFASQTASPGATAGGDASNVGSSEKRDAKPQSVVESLDPFAPPPSSESDRGPGEESAESGEDKVKDRSDSAINLLD